jgi:AcrR family transcriptional regulator
VQKSPGTRTAIVETAIKGIVKYGYASPPRVAEAAGVSRGAMMHHFSNRLTVIPNL